MNKYMIGVFLLPALFVASQVQADRQTVTLGYSQSKVKDFKNLRGANVKYRYEWQSPFSVMGSVSWMKLNDVLSEDQSWAYGNYRGEAKAKYYSLMAGPAWRINPLVSLYVLGGIGVGKVEANETWSRRGSFQSASSSQTKSALAYGAGVQINPVEYLAIDISHLGGKIAGLETNGFNVGIGYSF